MAGGHIGTLLPAVTAENITKLGFDLIMQTVDSNVNFAGGGTRDICWEASLNQ